MLIDSTSNERPNIASWSDDGTTFYVHNVDRFQSEEVPRYFKHNKFASFVRQLNCYGFHKVRTGARLADATPAQHDWEFHHHSFRQNHPDLLVQVRKTDKIDPASKDEVQQIREEVREVKHRVKRLEASLQRMIALLSERLGNGTVSSFMAPPSPVRRYRTRAVATTAQVRSSSSIDSGDEAHEGDDDEDYVEGETAGTSTTRQTRHKRRTSPQRTGASSKGNHHMSHAFDPPRSARHSDCDFLPFHPIEGFSPDSIAPAEATADTNGYTRNNAYSRENRKRSRGENS